VIRALILGIGMSTILAAGCGGSEDTTVDDPDLPYSFSHPEGFGTAEGTNLRGAGGVRYEDQTVIAKGEGGDLIAAQTQSLNRRVTRRLLPRIRRELTQAARQAGSVRGSKRVKVSGIDGFQFRLDLEEAGTRASALWTYLPKGLTLYYVICQWQQDREGLLDACREVLDTFEVK
jgi:hypothetical protein